MPAFVELPTGIFTAAGTWFHVRRSDLVDYAAEILDRVGLDRLIADAETVVRSPTTLGAWILIGTLAAATPLQAVLAMAVTYVAWSVVGPSLVLLPLVRLFGWLEKTWLQALVYVVVLSLLASQGALVAVWTGLAGFVLLRWGLLERAATPIVRPMASRLYALAPADQALRAVIVRFGLRLRLPLAQLDDMEARMLAIANRHRNKG